MYASDGPFGLYTLLLYLLVRMLYFTIILAGTNVILYYCTCWYECYTLLLYFLVRMLYIYFTTVLAGTSVAHILYYCTCWYECCMNTLLLYLLVRMLKKNLIVALTLTRSVLYATKLAKEKNAKDF